jgi:hypothetical protein
VEVKLGVETFEAAPLIATRRVPDAEAAGRYGAAVEAIMESCARLGLFLRVYLMGGLPESSVEGNAATEERLGEHVAWHRKELVPPPIEVPP